MSVDQAVNLSDISIAHPGISIGMDISQESEALDRDVRTLGVTCPPRHCDLSYEGHCESYTVLGAQPRFVGDRIQSRRQHFESVLQFFPDIIT
jgi:hypothetical protein